MKFARVRGANISHLRSKYFTAKRFHLPKWANFVGRPALQSVAQFSVLFDSKHINHQECHEGEADTDDTLGVYLLFKYEGSHEERKHYGTALI